MEFPRLTALAGPSRRQHLEIPDRKARARRSRGPAGRAADGRMPRAPRPPSSAPATRRTATSPPTSRMQLAKARNASRANSRRRSSPRCRRAISSRKSRSPGPASSISSWRPPPTTRNCCASLDLGAAYGRSALGAGQRVMVEFVSANPTGPLHVGHGRHAAFGATLANLLDAAGLQGAPRVLHQRRRPADGDPRGQRVVALPRVLRRALRLPRATATAAITCARSPTSWWSSVGRTLVRPAAEVFANLPPDAPAGDKDAVHRRRDRARQGTARRRRASARRSTSRSTTSSPTSARTSRNSASATTSGSPSAASRTAAPSIARSSGCAATASSTRRTAPSGSAPPISATRRTASWCARTASRPISPPTSPITCTSASAASSS